MARTLLITPFLIMPVVAGLVWKNQMFSASFGVLNWLLDTGGFERIEFVSRWPAGTIIAVLVWQWTPFMMLIVLAGGCTFDDDFGEARADDTIVIPAKNRYGFTCGPEGMEFLTIRLGDATTEL